MSHPNDPQAGAPVYPDPPEGAGPSRSARSTRHDRPDGPGHSRMGVLWVGMILAAVVLVLLLVFVLQNDQNVAISFMGARGTVPLGVALLLAMVGGLLIVAIPGSVRIYQLRKLAQPREATGDHDPAPAEHRPGTPDGRP